MEIGSERSVGFHKMLRLPEIRKNRFLESFPDITNYFQELALELPSLGTVVLARRVGLVRIVYNFGKNVVNSFGKLFTMFYKLNFAVLNNL